MSENIQSISQGTYTIGQTSAINFQAGPGIKIDEPSAGTVRIGNDETVLFNGTQTFSATLSESVKNFQKIAIEYGPNNYYNIPQATFNTDYFADNNVNSGVHLEFVEHNGTYVYCFPKSTTFVWHNNFTNLDAIGGLQYRVSGNAIQNESTGNQLYIRKVIGINRKNNA